MLIQNMILSNSYKKLFYQTGNPIFFVVSQQAKNGVDLTLPPIKEEDNVFSL